MKRLKVMPEFMSSGIWDADTGCMIHRDELKISQGLSDGFEAWIDYYDTCFESDFSTFKKGKSKKLNTWGRKLAVQLKKELPKAYVEYLGETEDGVLGHEKIGDK